MQVVGLADGVEDAVCVGARGGVEEGEEAGLGVWGWLGGFGEGGGEGCEGFGEEDGLEGADDHFGDLKEAFCQKKDGGGRVLGEA